VKRGIADFGARFHLCDRAPRMPPRGGGLHSAGADSEARAA